MNEFILTAYLAITPPQGYSDPTAEASKYIAKALYKEFHIDKAVSRIEKRNLNVDTIRYISYIGIVSRVVTEKRATYTWRF